MKVIDWRICSDCTEYCEYCFASEMIPTISLAQERVILDKIAYSDIEAVNISGGEPMVDAERCFRIMNALHRSGKKVYLSTNGYQVAKYLSQIKDTVSLLGLPLDGPDEVSNMVYGRTRESFERVLSVLENPAVEDIKIKIGTVVTKKTLSGQTLEGLAELMDRYPVQIWRVYEMLPENRAIQNRADLELAPEDLEKIYQTIKKITKEKHCWHLEFVTRKMRNANYMIIRPDGSVMIPIDVGNRIDEVPLGSLLDLSLPELTQKWKTLASERIDIVYSKQRLSDLGIE